jgi:hypothetical protein
MKKFLLSILIVLMTVIPAYAEYFSDIIVTSPNGLWTDERAYASLADAITAVGANERTIVVASTETVTGLTIPANVTLKFERGGNIANSGTLIFQTTNIIADAVQIFTGTGNVDFANGTIVKSSWFVDFVTAVNQTSNDYTTLLVTEKSYVDADCALGDHVILKSESYGNRIVANAGFTLSNIKNIECPNFQLFAGSGDFDFLDGTRLKLAWFNSLRSVLTWVESEEVTIVISGTNTVDYTQASTANEFFDFKSEQGQFSCSAGITLTIYSPTNITATLNQQIFSGAGSVAFSTAGEASIRWYPGNFDGTTDDQTVIQDAVNSLAAGSTLLFPYSSTNYYIESQVAGKQGVSLKGENHVVWEMKDTGSILNLIALNGAGNLTISGFKFYTDGGNASKVYAIHDSSAAVDNVTVDDCWFEGVTYGVKHSNTGENNKIINCRFDDVGTGEGGAILTNGKGTQIDNCYFYDIGGGGHLFHAIYPSTNSQGVVISNIYAEKLQGFAVSSGTTEPITITNAIVRDCYGGFGGTLKASNIYVFDENESVGGVGGSSLYLYAQSSINNFTLIGAEGASFIVLDEYSKVSNGYVATTSTYWDADGVNVLLTGDGVVIDSVTFVGTGVTTTTTDTRAFAYMGNKSGWTLKNCKFYNVVTGANPVIYGTGSNIVVKDNEFYSDDAANFHDSLIELSGINNVITGNQAFYTTGTPSAYWDLSGMSESAAKTSYFENNGSPTSAGNYVPTVASANDLLVNSDTYTAIISGTTDINGMSGTVAKHGKVVTLYFEGILDIKHNTASSYYKFLLPGAADITTAAGDVYSFVRIGSYWYQVQ